MNNTLAQREYFLEIKQSNNIVCIPHIKKSLSARLNQSKTHGHTCLQNPSESYEKKNARRFEK